ncbi:multidrug efflux MFS transporter AmvA [Acinetobacter apis]|uniref:MFS transporter, DHA2 family, multidrug resistance protein n=1 Tax=Acinetobacter apis TaxID=1229165 RepID=A0A217EDP9_9GAMM|nr:MFS transporter [Acinetobacter apis]SNQ28645.1 MFS transporter, DHA2 family, multidrug resistance protein [Acinetobacter apis]
MRRKYIILIIIILIYLPVTIDATVLYIAIPTLSEALNLSNNQLLWVLDIYSLIMAGLILPMGALGDRIGFKRLMLLGTVIFSFASLLAALSNSAYMLITARALLGLGASIILPATLAGIRHTFTDDKERNYALGIWSTIGGGGAAVGPLLGGFILEHFHWGMIFLINVPITLVVMVLIQKFVPVQQVNAQQRLHLQQALILISSILMLIYALKTSFYVLDWKILSLFIAGVIGLIYFIRMQKSTDNPMVDLSLFANRIVSTSIIMAVVSMMALVGFELLLSQELQLIHHYTPLEAGLFILPFMIAISVGGPFASWLMNKYPLHYLASVGMLMCATSFMGLAQINFAEQSNWAWVWMVLMGISIEIALLSSTAAIMSSTPSEKATSAGAVEGMAYELGAGLGITLFGLMLSYFYTQSLIVPQAVIDHVGIQHSLAETIKTASDLTDKEMAKQLVTAAEQSFSVAHRQVLYVAGGAFFFLAAFVYLRLRHLKQQVSH